MRILALELSSLRGSAALAESQTVVAEKAWDERVYRGQALFAILPELMDNAGWTLDDVDVFAAGRGPGSYSGLRIAVSAARALALPGQKAVFCVSSAAALAYEMALERGVERVAVCGDARRERAWYGLFHKAGGDMAMEGEWGLVRAADLDGALPPEALRVSPDFTRLGIPESTGGLWIREERPPRARHVAELAARRLAARKASDPLTPIYVHPPVFVPPRD